MQQTINIMQVSLRVLTAVQAKQPPDPADVQLLHHYLGNGSPSADELCCEVIQKALSTARMKVLHPR